MSGDTTSDPEPRVARPSGAPGVPALVIAFHSDLARVGQLALLGNGTTRLGRDGPVFTGGTAPSAPLLDPCVSREQMLVSWDGTRGRFDVRRGPGARRPLGWFDGGGEFFESEAAPGGIVTIGDRVAVELALVADEQWNIDGIDGHHDLTVALRRRLGALAASDETVLLRGETGTGKELAARALHDLGPRAAEPFVAVNCAALPSALLESELFGHQPGAFTSATKGRRGLFRQAARGTLLLDEIGELPLESQAKLLRAIETRTVRPVGADVEVPFECRIVAATHRDLDCAVEDGTFRRDLLMRLLGAELDVAPLRERSSDIPRLFVRMLARAFAERRPTWLFRAATSEPPPVDLATFVALVAHDWPGNVRELERFAQSCASRSDATGRFDPPALPGAPGRVADDRRASPDRRTLLDALARHDFVQRRVAAELGVPYPTLDRWMRDAGIRRARDVDRDEIVRVVSEVGGDLDAAAAALGVSRRGLAIRMTDLGLRHGP